MFTHKEKFEHRRRVWMAIWIVGMLMIGMVPFLPGVSATTVESTCEAAASPDTTYTWVVAPHSYNREVYLRWHVSADIGTGIDFTGAELNLRVPDPPPYAPDGTIYIYSTASWSGTTITGGSEPAETGNLSWSFSEASVGWFNVTASGTALTYLQNSYDATGYVYLKFVDDGHYQESSNTWTCYPHPYGMSDPDSDYPILRFTYGGAPATWAPTFTSSPSTSGTIGVNYTYNPTWNETVDLPITSYTLPAWGYINASNGSVWGTPVAGGVYAFMLGATSTAGTETAYQFWNVTVPSAGTWNPTITSNSSGNDTATVGVPYSYHVTANETVNWSASMNVSTVTAWAQLSPTADSFVSSQNQGTNYGANGALQALRTAGGGYYEQIFMRWNVSSLPAGATILHAYWNMYLYSYTGTGYGYVVLIENAITDWAEMGITYNNMPSQVNYDYVAAQGSSVGYKNFTSTAFDGWVAGQYASDQKVSISYQRWDASGNYVRTTFYSKDYTSYHPYLAVQYSYTPASWLSIDAQGYLNGTPTVAGSYNVSVQANNSHSGHAWQNFTITVSNGWAPSYTSSPTTNAWENDTYSYHITLNESATFTYVNGPAWLTANANNTAGTSFWLNGTALGGNYAISTKAVSVAGHRTTYQNYTLVVTPHWGPTFTSSPNLTVGVNAYYSYHITVNETWSSNTGLWTVPAWLGGYGGFTMYGTAPASPGSYNVAIYAHSVAGGLDTWQNWTINVVSHGWAPTFTSTPVVTALVGVPYSNLVSVNCTSYLGVLQQPAWSSTPTGSPTTWWTSSGTPLAVGSYNFSYRVYAAAGSDYAYQNFTLNVITGWAPTITSTPATTCVVPNEYVYQSTYNESAAWIGWTNLDGMSITFTSANQTIWGYPSAGTYHLGIEVLSGAGLKTTWQNWTVVVTINLPPNMSITSPANNSVVAYPWSLTVTWSASAGSQPLSYFQYRIYSGSWGAWSAHLALSVTSYTYTIASNGNFEVRVVDIVGHMDNASIAYTMGAPPTFAFTNTWIIGHDITTFAQGLSANWPGTTFTLVAGPSFATFGGSTITFTNPPEGHYTVTVMAHSNAYGSAYANHTYSLTITPAAYIGPVTSPLWEIVIPFIILMVIGILSAFSRDGVSGTSFLGSLTIGIFVLAWAGALGVMTFPAIGFGAFFMAIMLFRAYREGL